MQFKVERWGDCVEELKELFPRHWKELAVDQDKIAMGLDEERYAQMDQAGIIHLVTARCHGTLVGYYIAFIIPHVHYKGAGMMAFTDIYYIMPEFRRGPVGVLLFKKAERTLKEKGVVKAYLSCKVHQDHTQLFERLGWKLTDKSFTKYLG